MAGERRLWDRWQPHMNERFFVQRVENLVEDGTPDVYVQDRADGRLTAWVELKFRPELPKRATTRVFGDDGLRPGQVAWLYGRAIAGGQVFVLAGAADRTWLVHGRYARLFNDMSVGDLDAAAAWAWKGRLSREAAMECLRCIVA